MKTYQSTGPSLIGDYKGYRDLHIYPDWLLIYKKTPEELILILSRTGSHSDLLSEVAGHPLGSLAFVQHYN